MHTKNVVRGIASIFVIACMVAGSTGALALSPDPAPVSLEVTPDPMVEAIIDQVETEQLRYYDRQIAGELPVWVDGEWYTIPNRYTYSGVPIQKATRWVAQHMENNLGLDVSYHIWDDETNPNVIGEIPGLINPEDIFIIGGHIDAVETTPGADDDGSGSVATLLAADILSQYQWGCTLRFAFWTGEEQWMLGSSAYADMVHAQDENIVGYLNLDMLAWNTPGSEPGFDLWYEPSVPGSQEMAELFAGVVDAYDLNLVPEVVEDFGRGGDHESFWDNGYASIMVIEDYSDDFNPYYHGAGDNPSNMDFDYFTEFTKASLGTFVHFSNCLIPSGTGAVDGHVTDAHSGEPMPGVDISIENGAGREFSVETDASGYYTQTLVTDVYTVTASTYGYLTQTIPDVNVITDTVTTVDIELETAPVYEISGFVREPTSGTPLAATVQFLDAPVPPVETDPATGFYSIEAAQGTWTLQASADGYGAKTEVVELNEDLTVNFDLYPFCEIFTDDVENGNTGWTAEAPWAITAESSHSPSHSWTDSPGGSYADNRDISIVSPVFDLGDYSGVSLSFWHIYDLENRYDYGFVEISTDSGSSWKQAASYTGFGTWAQAEIELPELDNQIDARVRFRMYSDFMVTKDGWHIDDIVLTGAGPACAPDTAPTAEFSTNSPVFVGTPVVFSNETFGSSPITYEWDFGDGEGTSTQTHPIYTYTETGTFTVTLTATNELGSDEVSHAVVVEEPPVIAVEISGGEEQWGEMGETLTFAVGITNTGNVEESFELSVTNAEWTVEPIARTTGLIPAGGTEELTFEVTLPAEAPEADSDTFTITAVSQKDGSVYAATELTAGVKLAAFEIGGKYEAAGYPGTEASFTIEITNTSKWTDSFEVSAGGQTWMVEVVDDVVTGVAAGETAAAEIKVFFPTGELDQLADELVVTVTSQRDATVSAEAELYAYLRIYSYLLPLSFNTAGR